MDSMTVSTVPIDQAIPPAPGAPPSSSVGLLSTPDASPIDNNPLVVRCGLIEQRIRYGGGLLSMWSPCLAVLTVQGHLLLFKCDKAQASIVKQASEDSPSPSSRGSRRSKTRTASSSHSGGSGSRTSAGRSGKRPGGARAEAAVTPVAVLREMIWQNDPVTKEKSSGSQNSSSSDDLPLLPAPFAPDETVVITNSTVAPAPKLVTGDTAFELTEHQPNHGFLGYIKASTSRTIALKAPSQSACLEWVAVLRKMGRRETS